MYCTRHPFLHDWGESEFLAPPPGPANCGGYYSLERNVVLAENWLNSNFSILRRKASKKSSLSNCTLLHHMAQQNPSNRTGCWWQTSHHVGWRCRQMEWNKMRRLKNGRVLDSSGSTRSFILTYCRQVNRGTHFLTPISGLISAPHGPHRKAK